MSRSFMPVEKHTFDNWFVYKLIATKTEVLEVESEYTCYKIEYPTTYLESVARFVIVDSKQHTFFMLKYSNDIVNINALETLIGNLDSTNGLTAILGRTTYTLIKVIK